MYVVLVFQNSNPFIVGCRYCQRKLFILPKQCTNLKVYNKISQSIIMLWQKEYYFGNIATLEVHSIKLKIIKSKNLKIFVYF